MNDEKVLVPHGKLVEALRLLTLAGHNVEATILAALVQPSDSAPNPEPFFYAMCGPDGKPHYQEFCVSAKAHHLEPDADGVTIIPVYRRAQDLPNEGAEPVAVMYDDGSVLLPNDCVSRKTFDTICRVNTPLYLHPPEVKALVLPDERTRRTSDIRDEAYDNGWNDCLDRVKELNS